MPASMTPAKLPLDFDANSTASADSGLFGLPFDAEQAKICIVPVPWEVTTSYGDGTSRGPSAVLDASKQVDLFDIETGDVYRYGYFMQEIPADIQTLNDTMKAKALDVVAAIESGDDQTPAALAQKKEINASSLKLNEWVYEQARAILAKDKFVGILGGDHSSPLGAIRAISEKHGGEFGVLHVDAHADLRDAYQGYQNSHASIFHNVMESKFAPKKLVQVGIRDFSPDEYAYIQKNADRIHTFFDPLVKRRLNKGESWQSVCDDIVGRLPKKVYISFDIDGLSPDLCPNTGTPVPGGLSFDQALTLFATVSESGRQIVGFDLCEVAQPAPSDSALASAEWDGNVGARILFKLCGWTMVSNGYT